MEQQTSSSSASMEKAGNIIRKSIFTLLKDFHYFSTTSVILMLPFSASVLVSQSISQSWLKENPIFLGSGSFPFLGLIHLSQTVFIGFVFTLPFGLTSFVMAKASIFQYLHHYRPSFSLFTASSYLLPLYKPLAFTYLWSIALIITINMAAFSLLFAASNFLMLSSKNPVFVMAAGIVFSMFFTHTMIICNLALAVSGLDKDKCSGYTAICRACFLRKGINLMAIVLALPTNLGLVAIESLFRFRVVRAYHLIGRPSLSMLLEGLLIAYLFSIIIVLDTIACWFLVKSCESNFGREEVEVCCVQIEIVQEDMAEFSPA